MIMIYTHQNPILVENAKNYLAANDVEAILKNEFSGGALGELSAIDSWVELWIVDLRDLSRAKSLLESLLNASEKEDWRCESCGEENGNAFHSCWKCGKQKDVSLN